jgi:RNA polymerase sigma-70 factor (ECF subfamily)
VGVNRDAVIAELDGLRALARSLVHGDADADDLIQDTAVTAVTSPPDSSRPVKPWLATVLRNRWRMDRRSRARRIAREGAVVADEQESAPDAIDRARALERLSTALVALDEPFRTVIIRRYMDNESCAQIARALGVPAGTIRWRLKTGLDRLRAALDESTPRWRVLLPLGAAVKAKTVSISLVVLLLLLVAGGVAFFYKRKPAPTTTAPVASQSTPKPAIKVERVDEAGVPMAPLAPGEVGSRATIEEVAAAEGGVISGRVINWSTGDGVANAELTFTGPRGAVTIRSDANGSFELAPEAPGVFSLTTIVAQSFLPYAPELEHSPVRVALAAKQAVRGVTLFLFPAVDYYGTVVDAAGAPVAGARVHLADPPAGEQALEKIVNEWTSDNKGKFLFHAPDGAVFEAVKGGKRGWAILDGNVATTHAMTIKIGDAPPRDATIKGKTVDEQGTPIPDVLVTAYPQDKPGEDVAPRATVFATSGPDGTFTLEGVDKKPYVLIADENDRSPTRKPDVMGGTQDVTLTLEAGLPLAGVVVDSSDKPVASYTLLVTKRQGLIRQAVTTRSIIDPRGHFRVSVGKGDYELLVSASGWAPSAPVSVSAGTTDAKIKLASGATLVGSVVDADTGTPLPYARIVREGAGGGASAQPANAGVVTRADGTFELTGIPAGPFAITIGAGEYNPRIEGGLTATDGGIVGPLEIGLKKLAEGETPKIALVGIGVKLVPDGETILVEQVVPKGGADAAGIVAGDHIVAVDMIPVTTLGLDGAVARVRGVAGTKLSVSLQRGDKVETLVVERKPLVF